MAQALTGGGVTAAVCEVTVTLPVTAGSPRPCFTLTLTSPLITWRLVAAASERTFHPPESTAAVTLACELITAGAYRSLREALARFEAGGGPPACIAGAIPIYGVAVAVASALAGILAERSPAGRIAGALASFRMTAAVWEAVTRLTTV